MGDRGPRQIIGVLALDQVGRELLERGADRAVAQHQPVMRAAGNVRRSDRHGDRAALVDDFVARAGDDHQMPVRSRFEDVVPLVQQIGADPAADLRPALRQVAEQPRRRSGGSGSGSSRLMRPSNTGTRAKCQKPFAREIVSENFTHAPWLSFGRSAENSGIVPFLQFGTPIATLYRVHLVPRQRRDGSQGFSGPRRTVPSSFQAPAPSNSCNSPLSNISIMMSDPPTNSPPTYSCGTVGQSL